MHRQPDTHTADGAVQTDGPTNGGSRHRMPVRAVRALKVLILLAYLTTAVGLVWPSRSGQGGDLSARPH